MPSYTWPLSYTRCMISATLSVWRGSEVDEEVVRRLDQPHHVLELRRVPIGQLLGADPLPLGRELDRLAVLVGAGEEEHVFAALAHVRASTSAAIVVYACPGGAPR